jgi:tRNA(adenine34) deaminase
LVGLAPLAQLDRALDYESKGRRFESSRERIDAADLDSRYMEEALALARQAAALGEVPVGAVAVREGVVLGRAFNRREMDADPFSHAELSAMRQAAAALKAWRLTGVTVYVTLEPCAMCAGALVQARVSRLVYGAADPRAGAVESLMDLVRDPRLNHRVEVRSGVLGEEAGALLKGFFGRLRERDK